MNDNTAARLWSRLGEAGLVRGEVPQDAIPGSPWYVRLMLGFAGWIGALFLLGFIAVGFAFIIKSGMASFTAGAILCTAAAIVFRIRVGDFAKQFAFATSLTGQALLVFGLFELTEGMPEHTRTVALLVAGVEDVLFLVVPNFAHRVWSAVAALLALFFAFNHSVVFVHLPTLYAAAFAIMTLSEFRFPRHSALIQPLAYALAASTAMTMFSSTLPFLLDHTSSFLAGGYDAIPVGIVLLGTVLALLRREGIAPAASTGATALAGTTLLALVSYRMPGIGIGSLILLVGFAQGNRLLLGLGVLGLLSYLSSYYYFLNVTLLEKSLIMSGAGITLLAARLLMLRLFPTPQAGHPHA